MSIEQRKLLGELLANLMKGVVALSFSLLSIIYYNMHSDMKEIKLDVKQTKIEVQSIKEETDGLKIHQQYLRKEIDEMKTMEGR